MIKMIETDNVSKTLFDRLYSEAYPKISHERQRIGNVKLGESMFNELSLYKSTDIVSCYHYHDLINSHSSTNLSTYQIHRLTEQSLNKSVCLTPMTHVF